MNTGQNPKGYNNEAAWNKIEQDALKKKNKRGYTMVSPDENILNNTEDTDFEIIESEDINIPLKDTESTSSNGDFDDVLREQVPSGTSPNEDFGEVLQLTEYDGGNLPSNDFVVAEYTKVDVVQIDKLQEQKAKKFVDKITKFVLEFNDVKLTKEHEDYIRQVGELQLSNLQDLLSLVEINKQMINNIVARVNAVQAEDYAIIAAYNNLVNQHIKLIKEVSNTYKSIPSVIKKMRADVLSNQELEAAAENEEVITEEFGDKQFNNSKQLLKSILAKRHAKNEQQNNEAS